MNAWIFLAFAIGFEVAGTFMLKLSDGFEKWQWGVTSICAYAVSFWMLAPAVKAIPVGIAYAIWSGSGIVAISLIGLFAFDEKLSALQFGFIGMILIGAVGLNLTVQHA
ncbi:MAG: multidrug efflux SMR transporter [Pseudomonadota bacterium]